MADAIVAALTRADAVAGRSEPVAHRAGRRHRWRRWGHGVGRRRRVRLRAGSRMTSAILATTLAMPFEQRFDDGPSSISAAAAPASASERRPLGASEYSVQLSGNTIYLSSPGDLLPRKNVQVHPAARRRWVTWSMLRWSPPPSAIISTLSTSSKAILRLRSRFAGEALLRTRDWRGSPGASSRHYRGRLRPRGPSS